MIARGGQEVASATDPSERSSEVVWVCDNNPDHVEVATAGNE
jgi:hypothetical protein